MSEIADYLEVNRDRLRSICDSVDGLLIGREHSKVVLYDSQTDDLSPEEDLMPLANTSAGVDDIAERQRMDDMRTLATDAVRLVVTVATFITRDTDNSLPDQEGTIADTPLSFDNATYEALASTRPDGVELFIGKTIINGLGLYGTVTQHEIEMVDNGIVEQLGYLQFGPKLHMLSFDIKPQEQLAVDISIVSPAIDSSELSRLVLTGYTNENDLEAALQMIQQDIDASTPERRPGLEGLKRIIRESVDDFRKNTEMRRLVGAAAFLPDVSQLDAIKYFLETS